MRCAMDIHEQIRFGTVLVTVLLSLLWHSPVYSQNFKYEQNNQSVDIYQHGELLTTYHYRSGSKPILWPLIGPDGMKFSRDYPMVPDSKDEEHDHPHHRSIWMTFGEVNEHDLWAEGKGRGSICQLGVPAIDVRQDSLLLEAKHEWKGGVKDVSSVSTKLTDGCTDDAPSLAICDTKILFHGSKEERLVDFYYTLTANRDLHFGDTKEGMFGMRVPEAMRADKAGGQILSSEGRRNGDTWGYPARWIDYSGRAEKNLDKVYGIAILVHPNSFQANGRWHVRTYGLFAHNPFGIKDFPKLNIPNEHAPGGFHLSKGKSLKFGYRVILHRNAWTKDEAEERYEQFSKAQIP